MNDVQEFLSDPMFGYRDGYKTELPIKKYADDFLHLCNIANKIELISNPYEASRTAVRLADAYFKKGKLQSEMQALSSDSFRDGIVGHHRVRELERSVVNALERSPNYPVTCCTPNCINEAIKRSHVVQKNKILSTIVDNDNSVYQTKIHPDNYTDFVHKIGWNNASTFPGYCQNCESSQFSAAEHVDAQINRETVGKLIWRAMCFTRYRRAIEVQERAKILSKPKAYEIADDLGEYLILLSSAMIMKTRISAFRSVDKWIGSFEKGNFGLAQRFKYLVLELNYAPFVGAGAIPVHYDLQRNLLYSSRKFASSDNYMAFTSLCCGKKQYIAFAYDKTHKISVNLIKQLRKLDHYLFSAYLPQLVIANSDTVYLSPVWWETQTDEIDRHIVLHSFFMNFAQMVFPWWGPLKGVEVVNAFDL